MIAVVVGGTGLTGNILLRNLLGDSSLLKVISVGRKSTGIIHPKLMEVIIEDLKDLRTKSSELQGDYYFCALGTTIKAAGSKENFMKVDYQAIMDFGAIAKVNSAKSLTVISASGVKESSKFFYNQVKAKTENDLIGLGLNRLVIFRPGLLVGNRKEFRLAEYLSTKLLTGLPNLFGIRKNNKFITYVDLLAIEMLKAGLQDKKGIYFFKAENI